MITADRNLHLNVTTASYASIVSRNRPSLFAPPLAWAISDFAGSLIKADGSIDPLRTALVVVSDECSLATIAELSGPLAKGIVSPLRFAGASPSIVAGLPALEHGIRGPVLCLTMAPRNAAQALGALARYWLRYSGVTAVVIIVHAADDGGVHRIAGLVARSFGAELAEGVERLVNAIGEGQAFTAPPR